MLLLGITAGGCERGEDLMSMLGIMAGGCERVEDLMSMLGITARGWERVEDLMLTLGITARGCEVMEADKAILVLLSTSLVIDPERMLIMSIMQRIFRSSVMAFNFWPTNWPKENAASGSSTFDLNALEKTFQWGFSTALQARLMPRSWQLQQRVTSCLQ